MLEGGSGKCLLIGVLGGRSASVGRRGASGEWERELALKWVFLLLI
jgi:hypothetical protein